MTVIPSNAASVRYCPAQDVRQAANASHTGCIICQQRF